MIFEYLCPRCEATNIFKNIKDLAPKECRACGRRLSVQRDLIRYERNKDGDLEILLHERVEKLTHSIKDLYERIEKIELEIWGDKDDSELVTVN